MMTMDHNPDRYALSRSDILLGPEIGETREGCVADILRTGSTSMSEAMAPSTRSPTDENPIQE